MCCLDFVIVQSSVCVYVRVCMHVCIWFPPLCVGAGPVKLVPDPVRPEGELSYLNVVDITLTHSLHLVHTVATNLLNGFMSVSSPPLPSPPLPFPSLPLL